MSYIMVMAAKDNTFFVIFALCFSLLLITCNATLGGALPKLINRVATFNVMNFGAVPGGGEEEPSTMAFINAWIAACNSILPAKLLIPPGIFTIGYTTFQGPCINPRPRIVVQGTLKAIADVSEYPSKWWISFDSIDNLVLTGRGTFDGQGQMFWKFNDCKTNPNCDHLPAALYFNDLKNAMVKGINIINSMGFHMHVTNCIDFKAHSLHITAPGDSPNTDGIHISHSNMVKVSRSAIGTGDDCVSIGQGSVNVTITKIICGPGHGISIGSLGKLPNEEDVQEVLVRNCTLIGTTNGLRIKTWSASSPSRASGILFSGIIMENVQKPIIIDQGYGSHSNKPSLVKISNVVFQNIKGTTKSPLAVNLMCSSLAPCDNVHLSNINLQSTFGPLTSSCTNARVIYTGLQFPPPCK